MEQSGSSYFQHLSTGDESHHDAQEDRRRLSFLGQQCTRHRTNPCFQMGQGAERSVPNGVRKIWRRFSRKIIGSKKARKKAVQESEDEPSALLVRPIGVVRS